MVEIQIDIGEAEEYVKKQLANYKDHIITKAMRTAINNTAKAVKKLDERIAKRKYTAKKEINALKFRKATASSLEAILSDRGANISLSKFNVYYGKKAVSAVINRDNGRKRITKYGMAAFGTEMKSGHSMVGVRVPGVYMQYSKTRRVPPKNMHTEKIEEIKSISSPVMHGNNKVWLALKPESRKLLYENLDKEIERILGK